MLKDANFNLFPAVYVVCGYTDMRYGIDSLAAIIERKYKVNLFIPNTLFLFCGKSSTKIKGLLWEGDEFLLLYKRSITKGKREADLDGLPARVFEHTLSEEELAEKFPNGYKELPPEVYKRLHIIPETFIVDEHHVHLYAAKDNSGKMVRAKRPADLFRNSIATPALVASIINGKYVNALPIERQARAFKDNGIKLEPNTLSNWVIKSAEKYLSLVYDRMHELIYDSKVIHADETPVKVMRIDNAKIKNGKKTSMWVYRNNPRCSKHPIVLYDWQPSRKAGHPIEFLKDFSGTAVTDGYQFYHTLGLERQYRIVKNSVSMS